MFSFVKEGNRATWRILSKSLLAYFPNEHTYTTCQGTEIPNMLGQEHQSRNPGGNLARLSDIKLHWALGIILMYFGISQVQICGHYNFLGFAKAQANSDNPCAWLRSRTFKRRQVACDVVPEPAQRLSIWRKGQKNATKTGWFVFQPCFPTAVILEGFSSRGSPPLIHTLLRQSHCHDMLPVASLSQA